MNDERTEREFNELIGGQINFHSMEYLSDVVKLNTEELPMKIGPRGTEALRTLWTPEDRVS